MAFEPLNDLVINVDLNPTIQLRVFRRFLTPEHLQPATREKWDRTLASEGLTWDQIRSR